MAEGFTRREEHSVYEGLFGLFARLFASLPLLRRVLPLCLVAFVLAALAPAGFRWYAGKLASGETASGPLAITVSGLVLFSAVAALLRVGSWFGFEGLGAWDAQHLHSRMVEGLARTRTTFFDEHPSGRIINRLIRDFDEVRFTAIISVGDLLSAGIEVVSVGLLAAFASPWAALPLAPLLAALVWLQSMRGPMVHHAKSLSAASTSRLLHRQTDLVEGRETFLLYGKGELLLARMLEAFRESMRASNLVIQIDTWSSFWLRLSGRVFSLAVLAFVCVALARGTIDRAMAGVILSALFGINASLSWVDHTSGAIAQGTPHVRRAFEYVDLPAEETEERATTPSSAVSSGPARGDIVFDRFSMSYRRDTPEILRELSLTIRQGEKVALVGRTGSGKTSLTQALLRMVYVRGGDLRIGGESIYARRVSEVREAFAVVPQAPYLFAGTLASNFDPMGAIGEERVRAALREAGLALEPSHPIEEGGRNLSVGQRQLVCLARAVALDRPFVLLDEPTSGLDPETDARIHRLLRTALKGKTVITIAHRREGLKDYDRVIELQEGRVIAPKL